SSGSAIAKVITEQAKMQARVQPNSGESVLIPLVDAGELDFGIANVLESADAKLGKKAFANRPAKDLQLASVLFPLKTALFVRADSDIKSIADLKGKRVTYGFTAMGSITTVFDSLLATGGLTPDDFQQVLVPNVVRGADELIAGNADAFYFAVGAAKVTEADASVGGLRMLPMGTSESELAAMRKIFPYGYPVTEAPRPNLPGFTEPTPVLAYDNLLLTSPNTPDDVVYKAMKALYENQPELANSFAPFRGFDVQKMYKPDMPLEFHKGSMRLYKEVGLVK
ncbi:MAG: TAXI family TRAP transporter solute-binding subunit, partial [Pusillimonas sp.]|nr:TAXI family TRAP transporter solute-binding subunit [Pusillimonas sp.]